MSYKFLIVDDEPELLEYMEDLLDDDFPSSTIHTTINPEEGIDLCRAQVYDIIFTDFKMPQMSGDKFIEGVRSLDNDNKTTGVICLTAHGESALLATQNIKNVIVMQKPLDREAYQQKVRILLSMKY